MSRFLDPGHAHYGEINHPNHPDNPGWDIDEPETVEEVYVLDFDYTPTTECHVIESAVTGATVRWLPAPPTLENPVSAQAGDVCHGWVNGRPVEHDGTTYIPVEGRWSGKQYLIETECVVFIDALTTKP